VLESSNKGLPADPQAARCIPAAMSDSAFADRLEAIAQEIEGLEHKAIMDIAKLITKAHELFLYKRDEGGFTGWVQARLGYSSSTAYH
jgi:hypothetical protein